MMNDRIGARCDDSTDEGAGGEAAASGVETEGQRPGAVAVAIVGFADEADVAAGGDFFFEAAQISAEFIVADDTQLDFFERGPQGKGKVFFYRLGKVDGFDFPAEAFAGAFGELGAHAGRIDAGAFELGQGENPEE